MDMDRIFRGIGSFSVKFRWFIIAAWVVAAVAVPRFLPSLASVTQGNNANFLPASAPSEHAATLAKPFGGSNEVPVLVLAARGSGALTAADQTWLAGLQKDLGQVKTVTLVRDLGVSTDGRAAQLEVLSNVAQGNSPAVTNLVDGLRSAISRASPPSGMSVHLAGAIPIAVDQQKQTGNTGNQIQDLSVLFIIVLLLLIFRAALAPLITLIPAFLAITIAGPLVAEAAQAGLKVSQLAQILLIVLVLGAGTDYGLFLVFRVREQLRAGLEPREAVITSLTRVGESITFSAATVIAALLSLLVATFQIYSTLGIPLAIGIGVMLLAGLTLLPALLATFGRAAFWPSKTREGAGKIGVWGRVAGRITQHPALILSIGLLVFGGLAVVSLGYRGAGFGGETNAPAHSDSAAGQALLTKYFPSSTANPTNILFTLKQPAWADPAVLARAESELSGSGLFTKIAGPLNPTGYPLTPAQYAALHRLLGPAKALPPVPPASVKIPAAGYQLYRATAEFVSPDGHTVQFATGLKAGDAASTSALDAVPSIRAETTRVQHDIGAADSGVGGEAPALYDVSSISDSDLARVIPVAILVIGVLLALVMRSLVAPLYLIASVGLSYLAALGLAVLLFIDIGGSAGLTFILPFLMFIFLLALGEDYNILVMTRIREEARQLTLREAVQRALNATGTTVTSAGLVLAGTFGVFALVGARTSGGSQFVNLAVGLALGILMDTFLVRTLLVPSTVLLLGRWNWWPSRMSRAQRSVPASPPRREPDEAPV
ncbi:MAG TPA: MMPL family transporter [Streptosporangiaceae bacterium]|nr:MMPL family transporter [Streptosporangiaceae bacterium]